MQGKMENYIRWSFCVLFIVVVYMCIVTLAAAPQLAGVDGKSLFRSLRASNCQEDCSSAAIRPVCGTDGNTYPSRCELKKAKKCDGRKVKVRKKGRCSDTDSGGGRNYDGSKKCLVERAEATEAARLAKSAVLIPKCNSDGTFAEIQCHNATGYCWCVTKYGRHIPATSVKDRQPRCGSKRGKRRKPKKRKKKRKGLRRSQQGDQFRNGSPRDPFPMRSSHYDRYKPMVGACNNTDRQTFNTRLVAEFTQEYNRVQSSVQTTAQSPTISDVQMEREKRTVEWKFAQLDKDHDKILRYKEIRSFVRMVKKLIKPKACAKKFVRYCDSDNNRRIELGEWTLCLGLDIKDGHTTEPPQEPRPKQEPFRPSHSIRNPGFTLSTQEPKRKDRKRPERTYNKNCEQEQKVALSHHKQEPNDNIYIPRCQPDGKWKKAQCHKATEYCWCVEEETGMPIPGTSTHRVEPNCSISDDRPMKGESMKGCPFSQKRRFLVDLMSDLTEEMNTAGTNSTSLIRTAGQEGLSPREIVARWKLATLDVNKNGILEKKEWKKLRKTNLKNKKYPRKCRRNFPRYCDADSNQKVTMEEWKDCLGLNRKDSYNILPSNNRRGKKNPFIDQLT